MKIKNLLGLAAIGGGIYWMQKKRGGDMSFASIKQNFRGVVDDLMNKVNLQGDQAQGTDSGSTVRDSSMGTSATRPSLGSTSTSPYGSTGGTYTGSGGGYGSGSGYGGSGNFGGGRGGIGGGGNGGTRH